MWKAQKIELTKNSETWQKDRYYFADCYTLKIDSTWISNSIKDQEKLNFDSIEYMQDSICDFCGTDGCNAGGRFCIRRKRQELWFIPCFDYMADLLEYDCNDENEEWGDPECPPHAWYEKGILIIGEDMIPEFLQKLQGFKMEAVPFISDREGVLVREWERLVLEKPAKGFMRMEISNRGSQVTNPITVPNSPLSST